MEYGVNFGTEVKRADIVVMDKSGPTTVYMLVELKKPKLKDGKDQLRSYCNATGAPPAVGFSRWWVCMATLLSRTRGQKQN